MRRVVEAHRQPSPSSAAHAGSESSVAISPPPSRVRRRLDYYFMRSKEVKKERGGRARRASGYRMLCGAAGPPRSYWGLGRATGAVRGREAAAQQPESRRETLRGSSERSRPLYGLAALILRASAAFHALGRAAAALGFAPRRRYPANSRWARSPPNAENAPQTAARGLWSARTHKAG